MSNNRPVVHILGAGVDKPLGMPLANELMREVAEFANGEGKPVADAVRKHLPYLRFSFTKYTGEQGETFAERVLVEDPQVLNTAKRVLDRYLADHGGEATDRIKAVHTVVEALEAIRDKNKLGDQTLEHLAEISGEPHHPSGGDFIFNPRGVQLTLVVRQAFIKTFQGLSQEGGLADDEREVLTELALSMMNVEELLGELFSGFYSGRKAQQKQYLYVAWLFWAYLRVRMERVLANERREIYSYTGDFPENHHFITLNYTVKFFPETIRSRVRFFHGNCLSYIRLDTRDLIDDDERMLGAASPEVIAGFIESLDMDLEAGRVFLPGIVPPLAVKPVICREHLETWYECGRLIDNAEAIFITGYSFNLADEHFNDLLRKRRGPTDTRIVVINPDMDGTVTNVCKLLGQIPEQLSVVTKAGFTCKQAANLLFVDAATEQLSPNSLEELSC